MRGEKLRKTEKSSENWRKAPKKLRKAPKNREKLRKLEKSSGKQMGLLNPGRRVRDMNSWSVVSAL